MHFGCFLKSVTLLLVSNPHFEINERMSQLQLGDAWFGHQVSCVQTP